MKKLSIKRIFSLTLLLLFLICGSSWAASFEFTDDAGQWWSGSDFSITFDWDDGPVSITAVGGDLFQRGTGDVGVSLNTDHPLFKTYSLDGRDISGGTDPVISVIDISFFPVFPSSKVSANGSGDFFVAWDLSTMTLMLYYGDGDQNCYTYLGLYFSDDLDYRSASSTSITFTSDAVEAILGQQRRNCVPIPGTIWLLSSGLFGLVCIRRKNKS